MVVGLADTDEAGRIGHIGGFIHDDRRIACAHAVGGFAGTVRRAHHVLAAGGDREVAGRHQRLRQRLAGWGQKIAASLHFSAYKALPTGVTTGLVTGISTASTPAGLPNFTMPFSGISSMTPMLFWRSTSRRMPSALRRREGTDSPMPVSATVMSASRC